MKTDNLAQELRQRIVTGEFKPGDRFPSEYDLANQYQVNKDTANRAVGILVLEGFLQRKGRGAGTYVRKTEAYPKGTIAVIGTNGHSFFAAITTGIAHAAENAGYLPVLYCPPPDRLHETINRICRADIKGILTYCYGILSQEPDHLPIVYINNLFPAGGGRNTVASNDYKGGRLQAETLLKYGHRDVAYVSQITDDPRNCGFRDALLENGITDAAERIFVPESSKPNYWSLLQRIFAKYPRLTGLGCYADDDAGHLIQGAFHAGFDLPGKISMIGFGNVREWVNLYHLTTIEQHPLELGATACHRLIEMIEGKRSWHDCHEKCDVELKPGASVFRVVPTPAPARSLRGKKQ